MSLASPETSTNTAKTRSVSTGHMVITIQAVEAFMWRVSMKIGDLVVTKWECLSGIWVIVGGQGVMATKKYLVQNVATGELCTLHYTNLQPLEAK